ncbi:MAG: hypothetical protein JHD27_04400, partial [Chloroflexi bacterium]|nr:hypothetical protein [Chloroflexota bacterium]
MASLRELVQTLLPNAVPLAKVRDESMARNVTWVRVMRMRLPAFDGMESGDLALIPLTLLTAAAPDTQARADLVEYLAEHGSTGILLLGDEQPGAAEAKARAELAQAAEQNGLPCLAVHGMESSQLERSLIGAVVNRRAELERQAVGLERQIAALALDGQGLEALIGALAAF